VERFASEAMDVLRRQPQTVEEIGESNKRHSEFKDRMEEMWKLMDRDPFYEAPFQPKTFSDKLPSSNFWIYFHPKTTDINVSDYYGQISWILTHFKAIKLKLKVDQISFFSLNNGRN
jgi:hypothetical protein